MDTRMLQLLVCPLCKGPLEHWRDSQELACKADRLAFPIHDGIPVMLETEARGFDPEFPHGREDGAAALAAVAEAVAAVERAGTDAPGAAPPPDSAR